MPWVQIPVAEAEQYAREGYRVKFHASPRTGIIAAERWREDAEETTEAPA